MSQFAFLSAEFPEVFAHASRGGEPGAVRRRAAPAFMRGLRSKWLSTGSTRMTARCGTRSKTPSPPASMSRRFRNVAGNALVAKARIIKDLGNAAAHETRAVSPDKGRHLGPRAVPFLLLADAHLCARRQTRSRPDLLADSSAAHHARCRRNAQAARRKPRSDTRTVSRRAKRPSSRGLPARRNARRSRRRSPPCRRRSRPPSKRTNRQRIRTITTKPRPATPSSICCCTKPDGRSISREDREFPVTGMPNNTGEGFVDYVLWGDDGKPLGLVEAKRTRRDARVGQQQAKLYADCLEKQFGQRPIIFYTNGYEHWLWDDRRYPPRAVQGFLTKDELQLAIQRRDDCGSLSPPRKSTRRSSSASTRAAPSAASRRPSKRITSARRCS